MPGQSRGHVSRASLALIVAALLAVGWWQSRVAPGPPGSSAATASDENRAPRADATAGTEVESTQGWASDGRRDLSIDEARGGHTLGRHVGRTDGQLRERLDREPNISAASTYTDRATAERVVFRALASNASRLEAWRSRQGPRPNLALDYRGRRDEVIGRTLTRGHDVSTPNTDAVVVMRWDAGRSFEFVLTSYPETRR